MNQLDEIMHKAGEAADTLKETVGNRSKRDGELLTLINAMAARYYDLERRLASVEGMLEDSEGKVVELAKANETLVSAVDALVEVVNECSTELTEADSALDEAVAEARAKILYDAPKATEAVEVDDAEGSACDEPAVQQAAVA